jgi:membrane protein implicated in regulation of membrane protease activity
VTEFFAGLAPLWIWLGCAGLFLVLELAAGSAFFLCLSTAALITAGAAFILPELSFPRTAAFFGLLLLPASVCWWFLLRPRFKAARSNSLNARDKSLLGSTAVLTRDSDGLKGRLRVADASWPYVCDSPLKKGQRVVVRETRGVFLYLVPLPEQAPDKPLQTEASSAAPAIPQE